MSRFVFGLTVLSLAGSVVHAQEARLPSSQATEAQDSFTMEIVVVGGLRSAGWTLRSDETGLAFDQNQPPMREAFAADAGAFADVRARMADYRAMATEGTGCVISSRDVLGFRLTWLEQGRSFTASFSDSCGGIPTDFFDRMRPIGERLNRFMQFPQAGDSAIDS